MRAALLLPLLCAAVEAAPSFVIANDSFVKDGKVVLLRSGSIHYSRVPSAYWRDRLQRLQAMGLNTITTYVPWNWHEENEGTYDFAGDRDLAGFIKTAQGLGLMVLLRAGPYMCGEWEFGGFPAWLLRHNVTLRTYEPNYIAQVDKYFAKLLGDVVKPLLYSNGGPIVMVQLENEYGSYGNTGTNPKDKQYIQHLIEVADTHLGKGSVVYYTTDGGNAGYMSRGSLKGDSILTLGDGGWACDAQAQFNPSGLNPCMNTEDYTGWLTHWGEKMANTSTSDYGAAKALSAGHSFNYYMGHGGSNFGFFSGANGGGKGYNAHITSYDYDSPVSENGDHGYGPNGDKFETVRKALQPWAPPGGFPAEPAPLPRKAYGDVKLTGMARLLDPAALKVLAPGGAKAVGVAPVSMESLGQNYGLVYYTAKATKGGKSLEVVDYPRDRAQVFVDGALQGAIYRPQAAPLALRNPAAAGSALGVLVENMGRLNYGSGMTDPKGITTDVHLDGTPAAAAWSAQSLPLRYEQVSALQFGAPPPNCSAAAADGPVFMRGVLNVDGAPADTYLKPRRWTKGMMWVNGFNLGRYWETQGPQHAFFLPAPYLKQGANDVILLEMDGPAADCTVHFDGKPDFSGKPAAPCLGTPSEGEVLRLRECDSSLMAQQQWEVKALASGGSQLALGDLCLGVGPAKDPQSGSPSAQLHSCSGSGAAALDIKSGTIVDRASGHCLDITAHGGEAGEPTEWYSCNGGDNQGWKLQDTPSHKSLVVASMDGKCLSACK
eukprot:TRINITY_DN14242_c0_g1_i1.p1 TRINITY_DN14242_c0_g1~~TRINITY_DN14242_c0_g1_i1.p1  ORF type:complete len:796 (+),score=282.19 TRINITY_DN14242_c0_g1_i1:75-2390(+)